MWDTFEWLKQILETSIPEYKVELGQELSSNESRRIRDRKNAEIFVEEWKADSNQGQGCGTRIWRIQLINQQLDSFRNRWLTDSENTSLGIYNAARTCRDAVQGQQPSPYANPFVPMGGKLKNATRTSGIWEESFLEFIPTNKQSPLLIKNIKFVGTTSSDQAMLTVIPIDDFENLSNNDIAIAQTADGELIRLGSVSAILSNQFSVPGNHTNLLKAGTKIYRAKDESELSFYPSKLSIKDKSKSNSNQTLAGVYFETVSHKSESEITLTYDPITTDIENGLDSDLNFSNDFTILYIDGFCFQPLQAIELERSAYLNSFIKKVYSIQVLKNPGISEAFLENQS